MNGYEKLLFWLYKKNNPDMQISTKRSGVGAVRERMMRKSMASKADYRWEMANLYYEGVQDEGARTTQTSSLEGNV